MDVLCLLNLVFSPDIGFVRCRFSPFIHFIVYVQLMHLLLKIVPETFGPVILKHKAQR